MGIKNLPGYKDYWSTEAFLHGAFISGILTRTGYEKMCQYLHCSVPGNEDRNDKMAKVRPLITLCQENFGQCYPPGRDVAIGEAMVQFDGRLCWKQYMHKTVSSFPLGSVLPSVFTAVGQTTKTLPSTSATINIPKTRIWKKHQPRNNLRLV